MKQMGSNSGREPIVQSVGLPTLEQIGLSSKQRAKKKEEMELKNKGGNELKGSVEKPIKLQNVEKHTRDSVEIVINKKGTIDFGGIVFTRERDNDGNTIYEDKEGGTIDISNDGTRSFNKKNFRIYFHKNGNHNYIHKEEGLLFNEGNGFPNGVKKILKTINHEIEEELLKFTFIDNGIERTHYLNETGKILDESFNRLDNSNPLLDKLFRKREKEGDTFFIYDT